MPNLENIFLKLRRARERADALSQSINTFCTDHPIALDAQLRDGRLGVDLIIRMDGLTLPLREWSVELGEIVYLLRSALDNLIYVCAQTVTNPPPQPRSLQFPIIQDAGQYENAVRRIAPQLPPEIAELLEKVQPFNRAGQEVEGAPEHDPLVLLNWLSNQDKHRMPVPFLIPPKEINFSQTCEFATAADADANIPPDLTVHAGPMVHGGTLLEYRTKHPVNLVAGEVNITAHVAFETHAGRREISEALGQLNWYTKLVADEFSKIIN